MKLTRLTKEDEKKVNESFFLLDLEDSLKSIPGLVHYTAKDFEEENMCGYFSVLLQNKNGRIYDITICKNLTRGLYTFLNNRRMRYC